MTTGTVILLVLLVMVLALIVTAAAAISYRRQARQRVIRAGVAMGSRTVVPINLEQLHQATDAMGIGLVRITPAGRIATANNTAHRFTDRSPGSLVGKTTMEAFVDHRIEEMVRRTQRDGPGQLEITSSGEPQRTLVLRTRRVTADGGVWVVMEDVSELRRLQRIRTEFIDNLSHELRTPLTTVRLLTETLALELERTELPPRVRDAIMQIDVETGQLVQMVNELMDLSKIEQGDTPLALAEVDLGPVVERTIERLRPYAERVGVKLRGEAPASAADRTITADEQRVGQLLINLAHNAVKFSRDGGDVTVRLRAQPDEVVIEVEDHGVGIPRDEIERIFERFYKVDRARPREGGGTGLGLAIARHITERHGGRIWAESEPGEGATFFVALPRSPATEAPA
jgi:two-component system, OmpR family, phosphate regulon sensor histidine kinase PhoR